MTGRDDGEWESATVAQPRSEERPEIVFRLTVESGPEAGQQFTVDRASSSRVLVGQSPSCELRLTDRAVSRRHAALELDDHGLGITDLDSTNGTFVQGMRIGRITLRGGEMVCMGDTKLRVESHSAREPAPVARADRFGRLVGASLEMRRLYPLCERLAASQIPVIMEGETGTGKEVLAESLHERGPRREQPFVVFDCTTVAPSLVESELFGHERGAFTGAVNARKGVFEQAQGGTLFIDEIGDLDASLQPKLLRAIERSQIRRVGGDRAITVDVRIVSATRRDLDREVQAGRFRDDLFHRLAVSRVELPPLRKRRGDVAVLVRHFCEELGGDHAGTNRLLEHLRRWESDRWSGNVRELRNAVARQLALGDLAAIGGAPEEETTLADGLEAILVQNLPFRRAREQVLELFRQRYVEVVLERHGGNVLRAAEASGVGRRYFQRIKARGKDG
jgi:DNA-binding NtrC family response regulator